jgi:hypothetical protein
MPQRTRPLSAEHDPATGAMPDDVSVLEMLDDLERAPVVGVAAPERQAQFDEGVAALKVGRTSNLLNERLLLVLGGIIAPLGLVVVVLGWWGASKTSYPFEQTPYLISGGMLGLGLVFLGSFFYFAHWLTQLVKEHREQSAALLAAIERLSERLDER